METINLSIPHISRDEIQKILCGVRPHKLEEYRRALVHKSLNKHILTSLKSGIAVCSYFTYSTGPADNERLELYGDSVFDYAVTKYLFNKFPTKDEGFLTRLKIKIIKGSMCAEFCKHTGIANHILASNLLKKDSNGYYNDKLLEDAFEAFIAAIDIDLGNKFTVDFINKLLDKFINFKTIMNDDNYKDILVRYTQYKKIEHPVYKLLNETKKIYTIQVILSIDDKILEMGIGSGRTKKEAEQLASKKTLDMIDPDDIKNLAGRDNY